MGNTTDKTTTEILTDGLAYLKANGWRRHRMGYEKPGDKCPSCALGALYAGAEVDVLSWQTEDTNVQAAISALSSCIPGDERNLEVYNDEIATGKRDIERLFKRAIKGSGC
ncbi:DUF6197 family protein [Mycobacteroides abscessus]